MPVPYSIDLRWRAVWLVILRKMAFGDAGKFLFMSERPVKGDVQPIKQKHGLQLLLSDFEQTLVIQLIVSKPSIYLSEVQTHLCDVTGTTVHESTICRTNNHLGKN